MRQELTHKHLRRPMFEWHKSCYVFGSLHNQCVFSTRLMMTPISLWRTYVTCFSHMTLMRLSGLDASTIHTLRGVIWVEGPAMYLARKQWTGLWKQESTIQQVLAWLGAFCVFMRLSSLSEIKLVITIKIKLVITSYY